MPMEMSSEGMPARAQSMRLWAVRLLHFRGGEGQASKMARGLRRSSSAPPRTAASMSSIGPNPAVRKVPVTIGLVGILQPDAEAVAVGQDLGDVPS